jgi:sigma-B regulation protein RsbU (phosphoserine phosphatase)
LLTKEGQHLPLLMNAQQDPETGFTICTGITVHNRKKFEEELIAAKKAAEQAVQENTELQKARQQLELHTRQLDDQLRQLDRQHEELRQFNRAVTHDLQEPLRKTLVFSNMLTEMHEDNLPPDTQKLMDKLVRVVEQMRNAVSGLQQYVWLNEAPEEPVPVDLNALILKVQEELEKELGSDILNINFTSLPVISAKKEQIHLLLYHLFLNAVRFRKDENRAEVEVLTTVLQQNRFRNIKDRYQYEDFLRIEIRDKGQGFDPAYNLHVFDLFKRLHSNGGRGLGLSLCKKIVENHGGVISADSQPGKGTTITILFPSGVVPILHEESAAV